MELSLESRALRAGRFEVHAWERKGRGPGLVLLHGAAGHGRVWELIAEAFGDRRLLLVDLPGHGASGALGDPDPERLARHLLAAVTAVTAVSAEPLVWGGHSWGGKLAAIAAALAPDRVRAALLLDPSPASPVPVTPEAFVSSAFDPELGPWPSLVEAHAAARRLPHYAPWTPGLRRAFERGLRTAEEGTVASRARREELVAICEAALCRDHSDIVRRLCVPTLLLVAEESLFWQESTNLAALAGNPHVTARALPGQHWLHYEPDTPARAAIREWLAEAGK